MVVIDKTEHKAVIIDVAVPYDSRVKVKEEEKILKYRDLQFELQRTWNMSIDVIPIVIGALGVLPRGVEAALDRIGCEKIHPGLLQKSVLLGTAHILRKVLG